MSSSDWSRIKDLFEAALDVEPPRRAAFLAQNCDDDRIREQVEGLLRNFQKAGNFMGDPALRRLAQPPTSEELPDLQVDSAVLETAGSEEMEEPMVGRRIGAYKLVKRIGRGGMAAVFLAVRADDEYQKAVAIKLVHPGLDSPDLLNRFRNERQTLATLDHPNIVNLLDGGSTPEGLPFLVMDYVEGTPIDDYCDQHKLRVDKRLHLFSKVCQAVQYAHQEQVVHRDLKPSNILVTADGTPRLLDFGIAKVLKPQQCAQNLVLTQTGTRCMTPAYASPEQMRGKCITAATDIYSLGVILYELLTGHRPYRLTQHTPAELERAICEQDPETPSTAVTRVETETSSEGIPVTRTPELVAQTREGQPEKLRRRLRGDLDNIVLKALQKQPERRYGSVEEFAQDINCHLQHLPVKARQRTLAYRASKLFQRHKTEVVASLIVVFVLAAAASFAFNISCLRDRVLRRALQRSEVRPTRLTGAPGNDPVTHAAISPDGRYLAYSTRAGIHLKVIETGEIREIPPPTGLPVRAAWFPVGWFPDGTKLLAGVDVMGRRSIWVVSVLGGTPRELRDDAWANWISPDGSWIAFTIGETAVGNREVWVMGANGENPHRVIADKGHTFGNVVWSPDGRRIAYLRLRQEPDKLDCVIEDRDLKSGQTGVILSDPNLFECFDGFSWASNNRIVYSRAEPNRTGSNLWEIAVDSVTGRPSGEPQQITHWADAELRLPLSTPDGKRLVFLREEGQSDVYAADLEADGLPLKNPRRLTFDERSHFPTAWTQDSKYVLFESYLNDHSNIFREGIDQESAEPVVTDSERKGNALLSPDGSWILYSSDPASQRISATAPTRLMRVPTSGGPAELVLETSAYHGHRCARAPAALCILGEQSADRKRLIFTAFDPINGRRGEVARAETNPILRYGWDLSPDGTLIVLSQRDWHSVRLRFLSLASGEVRDVTVEGWASLYTSPYWAMNEKGVYISSWSLKGTTLLYVDLEGHARPVWEAKGSEIPWMGMPSPDGRHLAMGVWSHASNVWMIENF